MRILSYKGEGLQQIIAYKLSQNPTNYPSEVHYSNGQVMVALRGDDKIMVFKEKSEELEVDYSFKVGSYPRHFAVFGNLIFVACQKGNLVQKYIASSEKVILLSELQILTPSVVVTVQK